MSFSVRLRRAVCFCALTLLVTAPCALAQDAAKRAKIEEMFRLIKIDAMMTQMMNQVKTMTLQQIAEKNLPPEARADAEATQTKVLDLIASRMSWEKTKQGYIDLYLEVFTDEELEGMLAFYRSPVGKAMLEKMPLLMSKAMALGQKQMTDLQPELEKLMKDLDAKAKK